MSEKKTGGNVDDKIDELAKELKELFALKDSDASAADGEAAPSAAPAKKKTDSASKPKAKSASSGGAAKKTTAAKPAASKSAAKPAASKSAAKPAAAKSSASKSTAAKPAASKAAPKKKSPAKPKAETVAEPKAEPVTEPKAETVAEPKAEPVTEPKAEAAAEPKAEPAPEPKAEAAAVKDEKPAKRGAAFADKTDDFIKNKGKLPIFITVNALFLISAVLLMFNSFFFNSGVETYNYNMFQYLAKSADIKAFITARTYAAWANGAYTMIGILMVLAVLLPLALIVKNMIILLRKKDRSVYAYDAVIYFAAMLFYIAMLNLFGSDISAGQMISFILSVVILAFTVLMLYVSKKGSLPLYSIVNIVLATIALFLFTWKVYGGADANNNDLSWCAAAAASEIKAGEFMFLMMLISTALLILLVVMQMKRLPGVVGKIIEIIVPLAAAVCALIALIVAGSGKPVDAFDRKISGGMIVGVILIMITAAADTLFTFLRPLKKYKVTVGSEDGGEKTAEVKPAETRTVEAATEPAAENKPEKTAEHVAEQKPEKSDPVAERKPEKAEEPKPDKPDVIYCAKCGTQNSGDSMFCYNCGNKLK